MAESVLGKRSYLERNEADLGSKSEKNPLRHSDIYQDMTNISSQNGGGGQKRNSKSGGK